MSGASGRAELLASGTLFLLFLADVVGGRLLSAEGGTGVPDVVQFLVFFASVVGFTVAVLQKEQARDAARGDPSGEA
jgi:hypothetical protein